MDSIGHLLIDSIKALGTNIARQDPQKRVSKSECKKIGACRRHKSNTNTPAPVFGAGEIRVRATAPWRQIRVDQAFVGRHDGLRFYKVEGCEVIPLRSLFGAKLIEIVIWERASGRLHRHERTMDLGNHGDCVICFG